MSSKPTLKPLASAIGTTFIVSLAVSPVANADENPFAMTELSRTYQVAQTDPDARCGSICGGEAPQADENGEMVTCGSVCGEAAKCGTICGGAVEAGDRPVHSAEEDAAKGDMARCGSICAAVSPPDGE